MAQDITLQQAQQNPLLNSILAPYFQPGATLQQTQENVQQIPAQTTNIQASTPGIEANSQVAQQRAEANNFVNSTKTTFEKLKNKLGYVPPDVYNHYQQTKPVGLSDSDFESQFGKSFTDPQQQYNYNTSQGFALKQQRNNVISQLTQGVNGLTKQFNSFNAKGPIEAGLENNPLYKTLGLGGSQRTYDQNKAATVATLQNLSKNPNLAALGIKQEDVNKLIANLPDVSDAPGDTQSKMTQLQSTLGNLGTKATNAENPGVVGQGGKVLEGLLGQVLNPAINATNQVEKEESNPENKGNFMQSLISAGKATGDVVSTAVSQIPGDIATAGAAVAPGFLLGKILGTPAASAIGEAASKNPVPGDILKSILTLGKQGGKSNAGQAIEEAAGKGSNINWDTIAQQARESVANKGTKVQQQLEQLLKEEAPTPKNPGQIQNTPITSPQALQLRQGLGARLPSNFYEGSMGKIFGGKNIVPRNTAIGALRDAVSSQLKEAAPEIKDPDKLYSFYSKAKGDAPAWGKRILTSVAIDQGLRALPKPLKDNIAPLADVAPELIPFLFR